MSILWVFRININFIITHNSTHNGCLFERFIGLLYMCKGICTCILVYTVCLQHRYLMCVCVSFLHHGMRTQMCN